jgi:beta-lactamase regulating signal transducer with metallopeptidase domain
LLWLGLGLIKLRSIVARAPIDDGFADITGELTRALGVTAAVRVSDDLEGPATVGLRNPIVLLPRSVRQMSAAVQRAILCHELLHVKRRDWLHTIVEEVWRSLLWFHPHAHLVASKLSLSREMVVDEQTISGDARPPRLCRSAARVSDPQPHVIGVTPFIGRRTLSQRISLIAEEGPMSRHRAIASAPSPAASIAIAPPRSIASRCSPRCRRQSVSTSRATASACRVSSKRSSPKYTRPP